MKSKKWLIWAGILIVEAVIALLIARHQGLNADNEFALNARYLSDGCFVVGFMATGIGALTWISTTGFFDMMSYGVVYGVRALIGLFGGNRRPQNKDFYDYKTEKDEKRGKPVYGLLICGLVFIALSVLFLSMYYG